MKRPLFGLLIAALAMVTLTATDGPLTNLMGLRGRTDDNGYLRISKGTAGSLDTPLTALSNLRGRTDENGYLRVACADCGGSVTGSNTQVMYIDGTAQGADANFTWDKTNFLLRVGKVSDNSNLYLGSNSGLAGIGGIWWGGAAPTSSNYSFLVDASTTYLNAASNISIRRGGVVQTLYDGSTAAFSIPITDTSSIKSSSATAGIGYATGAGGTVTQLTSKATGATLNTITGEITMNGAALAAGAIVSFTFTNSAIAATDVLVLNHVTTGTFGAYTLNASQMGAGSCVITIRNNTAGSLSEAIVIRYAVIKAVTS